MGNRSSSHYPPPTAWSHGPYAAYTAPGGAYDAKRGLSGGQPGAYAEPYMPHPQLRRSMISLNADSGYMTSPSDSERMRMRGSRMSLNHLDFDRQLVYPPDPKMMKNWRKWRKTAEIAEENRPTCTCRGIHATSTDATANVHQGHVVRRSQQVIFLGSYAFLLVFFSFIPLLPSSLISPAIRPLFVHVTPGSAPPPPY
ncbi:hypothetical protein ANCDUO_15908 [Ancylostoma duodenale]|uniref:Uncharacterized protein n=1 Tax=Ancylostoma duodenale TaxID=51022 RepID=A0A0C2CCA2_9BILA|nr:hypothetical protein ANCDUO_15908 [Ancylostoma duodenale]